jgi:2,5-diketo-D-gluconate reductase A
MAAPSITLNDGNSIPQVGLGVWQTPPEDTERAVATALDASYRHIDTAAAYGNEREVGSAVAKSGVPREDVYLTTKLWNADQGYDSTLTAFDASMDRLGLEYLDLYLIHWPMPANDAFVDTFKAFAHLRDQGRIRSIGVSNFEPPNICESWWTAPELSLPSIRSSCIRFCSSRSCGKCTLNSASPPRHGVRWGRDHC